MTDPALVERFHAARSDPGLAVLEDFHPLKHALRFGAQVQMVAAVDADHYRELARSLAPDLLARLPDPVTVTSAELEAMAPMPPPSGIIALALRPPVDVDELLADPAPAPVVLLERPSRLGNIGAAVRVTAAAGGRGLLSVGEHDPWHPAALRGGAGLQFALPCARLGTLPGSDRPLVAVDPRGDPLTPGAFPDRALLAFGSERNGLSDELLGMAASRVAIPMEPGVSSLNLATAVAVALYAWRFGRD